MTSGPSRLRPVPLWAVLAAAVAPVALMAGWLTAGATTPGYDPVRSSVSVLAAGDMPTRWVMTAAFVVTGLAYLVTAVGLRPADGAGRGLLGVGGVAMLVMAWIPNAHAAHNSLGHMIPSYIAFVSLSIWSAVVARNVPGAPTVLRPRFGQVTAIVLFLLFVVLVADIVTGGATLGLRERVLLTAQSIVPLVVVLGVVRLPSPVVSEPAFSG
ncbi:MAG: DUF998 domain-containing protein [Actinomycetota bacterium]|nr:DUF998 domain-containing protein [Actinomycetota bacterium]